MGSYNCELLVFSISSCLIPPPFRAAVACVEALDGTECVKSMGDGMEVYNPFSDVQRLEGLAASFAVEFCTYSLPRLVLVWATFASMPLGQ